MQNAEIFEKCIVINDLLNDNKKKDARNEVIKLLDKLHGDKSSYTPFLNHLIREVGLFPYMGLEHADWQDRFVYEAFKSDVGEQDNRVLHIEQSQVLKQLLKGDSIAVSAPTSFGKSFIVDAFIAIKKPKVVVLIVPTVALADESRRRLQRKFSSSYKIITTTDASIEGNNIFVFPQERAFAYIDVLTEIDILIVDEFYKASAVFDDQRSSVLLNTKIEFGKKAKQRYYLAPNIDRIPDNVFTEGMKFLKMDFKTVVTKVKRLYKNNTQNENKEKFKIRQLKELLTQPIGKTLIYAGTYKNIQKVCNILKAEKESKNTSLLANFSDWLKINYGPDYLLVPLAMKGIGIHNGQLHRSLSQLQIRLFEEDDGIDTMVSTSSIIEGVNTQAESVILWSVKNGGCNIDYFTFRNIMGRAGRMLRYFVGKVYMLEAPPQQENTSLKLDFPDDVAKGLDGNNPGVKLNNEQYQLIKSYQDEMIRLLGADKWSQLQMIPQIKASSPTFLQKLVQKIVTEKNWPTDYNELQHSNTWNWRQALGDIIDIAELRNKNKLRTYACVASDAWNTAIPDIHNKVSRYDIGYEDMFAFERAISFNLSSTLALVNYIKQIVYPDTPDISKFIHKASNAFLPKLVFQLEEYGLPRMVSKKIQSSGLINLEDENKEINVVIEEFKKIGVERALSFIPNLHPFDEYIIRYFYEGISSNKQ